MLDALSNKFSDLVKSLSGKSKISEQNIEETVEQIKVALLEADVSLRVVRRFVNHTIEEAKGEKVLRSINPGQQFIKIIHDRMVHLLGDENQGLALRGPDVTSTILFLGLQGSGKTTSSAKLAARLKKDGRSVMLIAADLARPAAIEQLKVLGQQIDVPVYWEDSKKPIDVVKHGLAKAKKELINTVIVDTAGRLQVDDKLMDELVKIKKVADPVESILVADAMTGQTAVEVAKTFEEMVGLTGVILTKFDSDTRGGAALSLKSIVKKPIKFIGTGEKVSDFELFHPDRIASRILGMGDVVSLVEKAQETYNQEEAVKLQKKMASKTFTLEDYLDQIQKMRQMGGLQSLMGMMPGMGSQSMSGNEEKELKQTEAIILSMTREERINPRIFGPSRRKRVAKGSGNTIFSVNQLIKKFDKIKLTMKKVAKNKKHQKQLMAQFGAGQFGK
jgi:signal recognition particle subunit SRP54